MGSCFYNRKELRELSHVARQRSASIVLLAAPGIRGGDLCGYPLEDVAGVVSGRRKAQRKSLT